MLLHMNTSTIPNVYISCIKIFEIFALFRTILNIYLFKYVSLTIVIMA